MSTPYRILTINPGSTTTKLAVFLGDEALFVHEIAHPKDALATFERVADQAALRQDAVDTALAAAGPLAQKLDAVVGRGGLTAPLPGGTYAITPRMLADLETAAHGEHPCNLGAALAVEIAGRTGVPAYVVDPVVTDEMRPEARYTGLPEISRRSVFHALSQRGAARTAARRKNVAYDHGRFIVAHMGGGVSIGAHLGGQVVDVLNALDGEGPMSPERAGALPVLDVLKLVESGAYTIAELRETVLRRGGLFAHLGSNDFRQIEARVKAGDATACAVFDAFAYAVAKSVASLTPALGGQAPHAVVLTGGLANSTLLTARLAELLAATAPVEIVIGDEEMRAMAHGAARVLSGADTPREYAP